MFAEFWIWASEVTMASADGISDGPELIFGIVRPVGTNGLQFQEDLAGGLRAYGYEPRTIKLSEILSDEAVRSGRTIPSSPEHERVNALIDAGDQACKDAAAPAAVALLGISEIREQRRAFNELNRIEQDGGDPATIALPRTAFVLDSIKRVAEVTQLRQIYGDHFILISLQSTKERRVQTLTNSLKPKVSKQKIPKIVDDLIERDLAEGGEFGQNTLRAFPMADVFIDVDVDSTASVRRLLDLVFGSPDYPQPSAAEYGMQLASVSSTRSPELGLKVGAAIVRDDMTVVSLGVNAHPREEGSPTYDTSVGDVRDLVVDTLQALGPEGLSDALHSRLLDDATALAEELLGGSLSKARIRDLTEFQLPVHAEMNALLDALKRGASTDQATVYVTAYPCHNCAKHLVALEMPVRYIEPYPKSRAAAMYGEDVVSSFQPFSGVAPRRYQRLFEVIADRKATDGSRLPWDPANKKVAQPKVDPLIDQRGIADREATAIATLGMETEQGNASTDRQS
jgi:deoxycytidylate deaminase